VRTVLAIPTARRLPPARAELYLAPRPRHCERIVFGTSGWDDVPISTAVRAVHRAADGLQARQGPRRELVDGGIVSTTNLDIASRRAPSSSSS
jgi:hypothetical protein